VFVFCRLGWYDAMTASVRRPFAARSSTPCAKAADSADSSVKPRSRKSFKIEANATAPSAIITRSRESASNSPSK
jgi:hypothetical protein